MKNIKLGIPVHIKHVPSFDPNKRGLRLDQSIISATLHNMVKWSYFKTRGHLMVLICCLLQLISTGALSSLLKVLYL